MSNGSTWGKITSNAAKFWDDFGSGLDNITDPIDDFIDWISQPKELLQDSEGNYFGIDGLSSRAIKEYGATSLEKEQARERGSPFSQLGNIGSSAAASTDSFINMDDIDAQIASIQGADVDVSKIPYQGLLDLQDIDSMSIARKLYDISRGVEPNEIAGNIAKAKVGPNLFLDTNAEGLPTIRSLTNQYDKGFFNEADRQRVLRRPDWKKAATKAESEKYLDEAIKRSGK